MKRILSGLLSLCLLFSLFASAESIDGPIQEPSPEITVDRVYKTLSFGGEESLTHGWIVADVTVTNYSLHTLSVKDDFKGTLIYNGLYGFAAEPVFAVSEFEPLVRLSGSMVFKVPKLVLEAEGNEINAALEVDGMIIPLVMDSSDKKAEISLSESFSTPEELLVCFADSLKNADLETLISLFAYKEKGKYLDFDRYLSLKRMIEYGSTVFPDYEAYDAINALNLLPTSQINMMLLSLFAERGVIGTGILISYKDGVVTGDYYLNGEEMTLDEYVNRLNPERLGSLTLESICRVPIDPNGMQHKSNMKNSLTYGFSDMREYVLCVSFEGEIFYLGARLCRYPEGWKIDSLASRIVNSISGEFVKEDRVDDAEFDQLICTWENGEVISGNLLKEPEITAEDLIGTWTCDEGKMMFDDKYVKSISQADGSEDVLLYCISEDCLYLFDENMRDYVKVQITLIGDLLTLIYDEDTQLRLHREE